MNNHESLHQERRQWEKQLDFYKAEAIFLNNICARAFCEEVARILKEVQDIEESILKHEKTLNRELVSFNCPEFEEGLREHFYIKGRMTSMDYKFRSFKALCKKISYNNLALY